MVSEIETAYFVFVREINTASTKRDKCEGEEEEGMG